MGGGYRSENVCYAYTLSERLFIKEKIRIEYMYTNLESFEFCFIRFFSFLPSLFAICFVYFVSNRINREPLSSVFVI